MVFKIFQSNEIFKLNFSVLIYVTSLCIILQVFEAYLESKSKMCTVSLTNTLESAIRAEKYKQLNLPCSILRLLTREDSADRVHNTIVEYHETKDATN